MYLMVTITQSIETDELDTVAINSIYPFNILWRLRRKFATIERRNRKFAIHFITGSKHSLVELRDKSFRGQSYRYCKQTLEILHV